MSHAAGLRRLALRLVDDSASADDLVQETLIAALDRAPVQPSGLSLWLAEVLRNFAILRWRRDERRGNHERNAARHEALPSTAELAEQMEMQRMVADEVLRLEEPHRTAILAFYFDDVRAKEHAIALGVSASTARSQVKRGIEVLRARLERRLGDDRTELGAGLAALAVSRPAHVMSIANSSTARAWLIGKYAVGAAALAGCALLVARIATEQPARQETVVVGELIVPSPQRVLAGATDGSEQRTPVASSRLSNPASNPIDASNNADHSADLVELQGTLRGAIDETLSGQINPGAFLDAALALIHLDIQEYAIAEPSRVGMLRYPLLDTPPGIVAQLWLRTSSNPQFAPEVLSLQVTMEPPREHYFAGGAVRANSDAQITLWTDRSGKVRNFGVLTNSPIAAENWMSVAPANAGRIPTGVLYAFDVETPLAPTASESGLASGSRYSAGEPVMVVGTPIAERTDDLERFNAGLTMLRAKLER